MYQNTDNSSIGEILRHQTVMKIFQIFVASFDRELHIIRLLQCIS